MNSTKHIIAACILTGLSAGVAGAQAVQPAPFDLKKIEKNLLKNQPLCREASIGIATSFGAQGTGVVVSKDGIILTAAHVVDSVGAEFDAVLADGKMVKCICVLINHNTDSAIGKIIEKAPEGGWKHRPIRTKKDLTNGEWCTVIANGGGIQLNRPAPFRVGRILTNAKSKAQNLLISDCTVVSGDSGGPLFDLDGNLAGINTAVGPESALDNKHVSSQTFISQWGDYLLKGKKLPTVAEAKRAKAEESKDEVGSGSIPKSLIPQLKQALKKQWPDLNDAAISLLLSDATFKNGELKITATKETIAKFEKLGFDPTKYGLKLLGEEEQEANPAKPVEPVEEEKGESKAKTVEKEKAPKAKKLTKDELVIQAYGKLPTKAHELLKASVKDAGFELTDELVKTLLDMGVDIENLNKELVLKNLYGEISKPAMDLLKSRLTNVDGNYTLKLDPEDAEKLKGMGVIVKETERKVAQSPEEVKEQLTAHFKQQYGSDLSDEALKILLSVAKYDKKTGKINIQLDAGSLQKLIKLGVKMNLGGKDYSVFSRTHGDSAPDVISQLPAIDGAIEVRQGKKSLGLATPIKQDGLLVCKASQLDGADNVSINMSGVSLSAKVLATDEESDLALLKVDAQLKVVEWAEKDLSLGKLLAVVTEEQTMLGAVSVNPRVIPTKTKGIGNGNKVILGVGTEENDKGNGVKVNKVFATTPAAKAGLKEGDIITFIGKNELTVPMQLRKEIGKFSPDDKVEITVIREGETLKLMLVLEAAASNNEMFSSDATNTSAQSLSAIAGDLSGRRVTFPECFSHDAIMWAEDCGGPVYTIDGKLAGINIARFSRTTNYALTRKSVEAALERMLKKAE
mgnify:CR=1 FL=1